LQNISLNTLFVGRKIIQVPTCASTNTLALDLLYKNEATEGTVVTTLEQTQGRGQRGNTWEAQAGQNITLSVVLLPRFLAVHQQFYLNMAFSLAALDLARTCLPGEPSVKWPNDLFYADKKWGGMLIENGVSGSRLQHTVLGLGINVNQEEFQAPQATSFARITGKQFVVNDLIGLLLQHIESRYLELRTLNFAKLRHDYLRHLYRYQEKALFEVGGEKVSGQIQGVDENGRLSVQIEEQVRNFNLKEITFLF
jgi:BirA family transcriptional regulator, biotin operon repressor / biotin---[acetyl-CoA-carboxylase] ligase